MRLWTGRDRVSRDVERLLEAHRPLPRTDFVHELARGLGRSEARHPLAWSRVAFVTALSVLMLGVFASFGGVSYAAGRVDSGVEAVKNALGGSDGSLRVSQSSPASDQYGSPPPVQTGGGVLGSGGGASQPSPSGSLPFTGFPLIFTMAIGIGLMLVGILLRRRELRG
jgi:hypothetical protein